MNLKYIGTKHRNRLLFMPHFSLFFYFVMYLVTVQKSPDGKDFIFSILKFFLL